MEDQVIKKGYWAYMLRVDVEQGFSESSKSHNDFMEWAKKYDCVYYIVGYEISENGKPHLQCIVWFENKVNQTKLRNWWKTRCAKTKQPVAFASAKKIKNLSKYSMKDKKYITNLHNEEIAKIGKWDTPTKKRAEWNDELDKKCKEIAESIKDEDYEQFYGQIDWETNVQTFTKEKWKAEQFCEKILEYFREKNKRPNRSSIQYLMWKYKIIDNSAYTRALHLIPRS
jgi:hypothetical protein